MSGLCTVLIHHDQWRVLCLTGGGTRSVDIDCAADAGLEHKARAAAEQVNALSASERVVLAIPSGWCLSATIDVSEVGRSNRREAMRYLLEEHLPLSAEESVVDFVQRHGRALGVACELDRVRPVVEALREVGMRVAHICPTALLIGAQLAKRHPDVRALCIATAGGVDLIALDQQQPVRWWWLAEGEDARESVEAFFIDDEAQGGSCVTLGLAVDLPGISMIQSDAQIDGLIASQSAFILEGDGKPWADLGRDALSAPQRLAVVRSSVGVLAAGVVALLICTSVATFWRGRQYAERADELQAQQVEVYKELMPGQRVPASIASRLKSEQRRLAGLGGEAGQDAGEQLHPTSALTHLQRVLAVWPQADRCRLSDMTIEPGLVRVNGQATDSVIPERLAAALRDTGAYDVDAPNTRALSDFGYSFGFVARPVERADAEPTAREARR